MHDGVHLAGCIAGKKQGPESAEDAVDKRRQISTVSSNALEASLKLASYSSHNARQLDNVEAVQHAGKVVDDVDKSACGRGLSSRANHSSVTNTGCQSSSSWKPNGNGRAARAARVENIDTRR